MIILNILVFIFVLGLLVFFHELGHFLAAKACGIYVDRFSLGMPPRIFGIRWGETDYCIGALPIGGYVKMAGQEDVPSSEQEQAHEFAHVPRERWFNTKPVWQRMIVIIAGPLMNIVLALLLYALVTIVGAEVPASDLDSRIGFIAENSVAASALMFRIEDGKPVDFSREPDAVGWETGDRIVSIDGSRIRNMRDVMFNAILGGTEVRDVLIERPAPDSGEPMQFISRVAPRPLTDRDPYPRFGTAAFNAALIDAVQPGSPAEAAGLKSGDIIERANGRRVDAQSFTAMVLKMNDGQTLELDVKRGQEQITLQFQPRKIGRIVGIETSPTLIAQFNDPSDAAAAEMTPLEIVQVTEEFHKETGLRPGDQIVEVDGQPATAKLLRDFQSEIGKEINAKVHRPAVLMGLARSAEDIDVTLKVESIGWVGVRFREQTVLYKLPVRQALVESFTLCKQDIERTILTLVSLFSGTVSANELGGPILIYQLTTTAAGIGLATLLKMTAFISVNLCIINLLPIPVADGGHMVFLTLEAIRRKPLDIRIMERIQQAGLVLLLLIFLFVTFNDLNRLLFGWMR